LSISLLFPYTTLFRSVLCQRVPIHHVPPSLKIIGTFVLVLQIIRVLPDVHAEDGRVAIHQRAVLIWRRNNFELSILVLNQPRPRSEEHTSELQSREKL